MKADNGHGNLEHTENGPTKIRVAIVDDTREIRALLRRVLTDSGVFDVVGEADNGRDGIDLAVAEQPDVVLLDLAMPVMSGFEAIPSLVARCPRTLIVVLSGFNTDSAAGQALDLGAHAYIEKRFRPDELVGKIVDIYVRSGLAPQTRPDGSGQPVPIEPFSVESRAREAHRERSPVLLELRRINAELARSNAGLATFAAVAAHDLRSPLHVVLGFSELLASAYSDRLDDDAREMIASIVGGAQRMELMIEALLAHCRLDSTPPLAAPADLDDIVQSTLSTLAPDIARRSAVVTTDHLPIVNGDALQLQTLLQNLIANALKFSREDLTPQIHVGAERTDDGWAISVADNGIGIEESRRDDVFGMFVRLHPQGEYVGTGIGLASCKRIVEGHGGTIHVEENRGGGTRFVIELPDGPLATPGAETNVDLDALFEVAARPLEVLLVEDNADHAKLVAALLRRADQPGFHLVHVESAAQAREALTKRAIDCILLDLSLPDTRELEGLELMRSMDSRLPIVVVTSSADEELAYAAVANGAQDYLVKGHIDGDQLSRAIRWAVQRKARENELARGALHDPLTRLPNRTLMLDRLASALARAERTAKKVAVYFLDLDGFKAVNDRFGHETGDRLLVDIADRLRGAVRPQDTVARIGGDEFVVICEGFQPDEAEWEPVRRRLSAAVESTATVNGHKLTITTSIGMCVGGPEMEPEAMLRAADVAMYEAKRYETQRHETQRNEIEQYTPARSARWFGR